MDLHLKDKIVLITGGAKGIGAGTTRAFAEEGAVACVLARNRDEGEALVGELRAKDRRAEFFFTEMTNERSVKKAVDAVAATYGRINVIVNNAGGNDAIGLRRSPREFADSLEKNVIHYFTLVHYALDHLIASRGNIVNIGSKTAVTGQGGTSGYAAAKGAVNALTREWALDLARYGIRVNAVIPAEVLTPLYERWLAETSDPVAALEQLNRSVPLGRRTTTIEEIADAVVFIASSRSSHTTGQLLFVDGGYVHFDRAYTGEATHLKVS
jgi:L-fucose dehydrogenase